MGPDPVYCLKAAKTLFGSYRKDEVNDPDVYCAAIAATFSDFPQQVIDSVVDPRTGLASEIKWVPNVAEVRAACVKATARRDHLAKPTLRLDRKQYFPPVQLAPGTSYFEMFAKHGRPIGPFEKAIICLLTGGGNKGNVLLDGEAGPPSISEGVHPVLRHDVLATGLSLSQWKETEPKASREPQAHSASPRSSAAAMAYWFNRVAVRAGGVISRAGGICKFSALARLSLTRYRLSSLLCCAIAAFFWVQFPAVASLVPVRGGPQIMLTSASVSKFKMSGLIERVDVIHASPDEDDHLSAINSFSNRVGGSPLVIEIKSKAPLSLGGHRPFLGLSFWHDETLGAPGMDLHSVNAVRDVIGGGLSAVLDNHLNEQHTIFADERNSPGVDSQIGAQLFFGTTFGVSDQFFSCAEQRKGCNDKGKHKYIWKMFLEESGLRIWHVWAFLAVVCFVFAIHFTGAWPWIYFWALTFLFAISAALSVGARASVPIVIGGGTSNFDFVAVRKDLSAESSGVFFVEKVAVNEISENILHGSIWHLERDWRASRFTKRGAYCPAARSIYSASIVGSFPDRLINRAVEIKVGNISRRFSVILEHELNIYKPGFYGFSRLVDARGHKDIWPFQLASSSFVAQNGEPPENDEAVSEIGKENVSKFDFFAKRFWRVILETRLFGVIVLCVGLLLLQYQHIFHFAGIFLTTGGIALSLYGPNLFLFWRAQ